MHAHVVFADDIRTEISGKLILVGVYPDALVPASIPATFPLTIWARLNDMPIGAYTVTVTIKLDSMTLHSVAFPIEAVPGKPFQIILSGVQVKINASGALSVSFSTDAHKEFAVSTLPIEPPRPIQGSPKHVP